MKDLFEKLLMAMVAALTFGAMGGEVTATAMTAQQRYPWNGLVDITVTLSGTSNDAAQVACTFVATNSATHAVLNVFHVIGSSVVSGNGSTWTRQFVWDAKADLGEVKIADVELAVEAKPLGGVQLWENGPYWAECNVGATKPEECGYYFWWGDTVGYSANTNRATWTYDSYDDYYYYYWTGVKWVSSKWSRTRRSPFNSTICPTSGKTKLKLKSAGYIDSTDNLVAAHDAATAHLGAPWRMPTDADFADLISMCDMNWEICNGVWGLRVTGKDAYVSRSIFLPAAGYGEDSDLYDLGSYGSYWSSTHSGSNAWSMDFDSSDSYWDVYAREFGQSVRPVRGYATFGPVFSTAMTHVALDTRTGMRYAQAEELIAFSTVWSAGVTQLVLTVDGVNVLTTTSATNGVYVWKPDLPMTRIVTLELTTCGTVNETLTAMFGAPGGEEPAAGGEVTATAVTTHQQYPWNGLVDITVTLSGASNDAARAVCMFVATNSATQAALNVFHVTGGSEVSGSGNTWTRRFVWDAKADVGAVEIADLELAVEAKPLGGVQLWAGGPYWAECNVGATKPEECGYYFWWGDTVGYSANTNSATSTDDSDGDCWEGVKWVSSEGAKMRNSPFSLSVSPADYSELRSAGYIDSADNLVAAHDAATAHLGAPWRMPTGADFADLKNKCDMAWEACNGVWGMRVTGKGAYASKSIFLPAAGYGEDFDLYDLGSYGSYWSSSCSDLNAWGMDFDSSDFYWSEVGRSYGQSVRPVRGYATFGLAFSAATTHLALDTRTEPGGEEPGGEVTATAMTAQQRYPWNGLVDITVTLSGASNDAAHVLCTFVATNSATHAALNVSHVSGDNVVSGSGGTWMRRFVWDATADIGEVKIADLELAVEAKPNPLGGVQLWEGGPHWAECNVGASNPEEYGYYFWWGGTVGYDANTNGATWTDGGYADGDYWDDVEWVSSEGDERSSSPFALPADGSRLALFLRTRPFRKTISELQSAGYIDSTGNLVAAYDAATAHLGTPWRMPTAADFAELISKCDTTWETCNGVWGRRVTGKGTYASRSIFLPAAGYDDGPFLCYLGLSGCYWSSTPDSNNENYAWDLELDSSAFCRGYIDRNFGQSVRPVRGFAMFGVAFSAATTHVALDTRIGTRCAQAEEPIAFGADWNVGVTQLVLTVDGVNVLTTTSPTNGVYIWKPDLSTSRTVTLEHTTYGTVNETLTAAFDVTGGGETGGGEAGGEVTATAMTAQQRYPWNGLVDITVTLSGTSNDAAQVACRFVATNSATHAALNVLHVTGGSVVSGSGSTWTRQFVWDAAADIGEVKIADLELAVEAKRLDGVQLWENGPYWAECNVGAIQPEEYGYYFWWGDTIGYSANTNGATWIDSTSGGYWDGVTWVSSKGDIMSSSPFSSSTCPTYDKTFEQLQSAGYIDSRRDLLPAHDAATAHLGVPWRMPTRNDVDELFSKCYMTWETCNGVWGLRVTGKGAYLSKSIFLPAVGDGDGNRFRFLGSEGYYWDATYAVGVSGRAGTMHISSGNFSEDSHSRSFGQSVRPVRGFATLGLAFSAATTHLALDTRTGTRCVQAEELIAFSTDWDEGVTQLVLTVDGENVLTTTSPTNGVYVWKPDQLTTRVAMLELTTCGTVNETLIATFTPCVYVDAAKGNDAWDGSSAGQAVKTLARAYALAEAGNVIVVAAGTYDPVTATGKAVTFRGADGATIDGAGVSRCVTADDDVVFENFILQNGRDAASGGGAYGGTFERCTIRDCHSDQNGGGAYEAILRLCAIVGNTAENGCGGGAYGGILVGCVVKDNVAGEAGGGVFAPESMSDTTFSGNSPEDSPDVGETVKEGGMHVYVPSGGETGHVIPHDWFLSSGLAKAGDSTTGLNARLAAVYANGLTGWESYVAGLSPNDATSQFRAVITIKDGKVGVSWTPDLNSNGVTRIYTPFGRTDLEADDWGTPVRPWHRFFKVKVAMPTGSLGENSAVAGECFVPEALGGVQLWENGPYWAECNVGATKPEEYGYYFWWGDTVGYSAKTNNATWVDARSWNYWGNVTWVSNKGAVMSSSPFSSSTCPTHKKTTAQLQSEGYIDSTGNLVAAHDAATAHLGAPWRMPTYSDFKDLVDKCDTIWETCNGVWGRRVTGRGAYSSKSIFLPAAGECEGFSITNLGSGGYYWSSMLDSYISYAAFGLWFYSDDFTVCYSSPSSGWSVRPVRDSAQ